MRYTSVEPVVAMIVLTDFEKKTDDVTKERRANLVKWADGGLAGLRPRSKAVSITRFAQTPKATRTR